MVPVVFAQDTGTQDTAETETGVEQTPPEDKEPSFDRVELKDGSIIMGEIDKLDGGKLTIKTAFEVDEIVTVKWDQIAKIETGKEHIFALADGTEVKGKILRTGEATFVIQETDSEAERVVLFESIHAINPVKPPDWTLDGSLNFGAAILDGNTQTKNVNFNSDAVFKMGDTRTTAFFQYNFAEDTGTKTADNLLGNGKFDYFFIERLYGYASILGQSDEFQDLNMRLAFTGGLGYQIFKADDFDPSWVNKLDTYAEIGAGYIIADFITSPDEENATARWSLNIDWPICDGIVLFHFDEIFPSLERVSNLFVNTRQGIRFDIWGNLIGAFQVNWQWQNEPSPGFERSDTQYLMTLGYKFGASG